jgi:20S proteasome subunit alpha 3
LRPFGVSFLIAGWDEHFGFQLFQSDPSGNYGGWKATAIGANNQAAQSILKQDYKEDINMAASLKLAIKVLSKSMDSTTLSSDKVEFVSVTRQGDSVKFQMLSNAEVDAAITDAGFAAVAAGAE